MFVDKNSVPVASLSKEVVNSGREDMFVIEVISDGENVVLIIYGFDWKGTWAGGTYFKEFVACNLNAYSQACYVFHWVDETIQDGVPQSNEISLVFAIS